MTKSLRSLVFVLASLASLAAGCSESHMGDPTDSGGLPTMDGSARDSGPPSTTDSGPSSTTDSGTPSTEDTGVPTGTDSSIPPDPTDSGPPTTSDAGPAGVTCGTATCVDPQICCVAFAGGMATMTCSAPADCMGVAASCDGPEDCASGEACCGMFGGPGGGGGTTSCVAEAMCTRGRLCHADADCTGMDTCCSFMGASVCSPRCFP